MEKEPQPNIEQGNENITKLINKLTYLKDECSSEIPDQIIEGNESDIQYKVRKNWWNGLVGHFENVVISHLDEQIHSALIEKIRQFISDYTSEEFQGSRGRLTTKEDIERADDLIEEVISTLENLQNST